MTGSQVPNQPAGGPKETTAATFRTDVLTESTRQPVLLQLFSPGSEPCRLLTAALGLYLVLGLHAYVALRPVFAAWDARELVKLLLVDVAAFVPFYGAGLAIGQVFIRWPRHARKLYAVNLLGSGAFRSSLRRQGER